MRTSLWLILWFTSCTAFDPANSDQESLVSDGMVVSRMPDATSADGPIASSDLAPRARCPEFMVQIPGATASFCIDQYESSIMRIIPTGGEEPWPFDRPVDGQTVRAVVRPGQKPQAYISGAQASDACKRSGKRLCSEAEWLAACQGSAHHTYPYGNTYVKGACNEGRATNPVNDCFGSGSGVFTYANMNSPCCVNKPNTLAQGGGSSEYSVGSGQNHGKRAHVEK